MKTKETVKCKCEKCGHKQECTSIYLARQQTAKEILKGLKAILIENIGTTNQNGLTEFGCGYLGFYQDFKRWLEKEVKK